MASAADRKATSGSRPAGAVVACLIAMLVASLGVGAGAASASTGGATEASADVALSAATGEATSAAKAKKRCRTVRVKKRTKNGKVVKRNGKPVFVKRKKCKKVKPKPKPKPTPSPTLPPTPTPTPTPAGPKLDQILGWSTVRQAAVTPPAGLVPNGGTITSCTVPTDLAVYVRSSGSGPVGVAWKLGATTLTQSTGTWTPGAHFWYLSRNSGPLADGVYSITWSAGGKTVGTASVTRDCV